MGDDHQHGPPNLVQFVTRCTAVAAAGARLAGPSGTAGPGSWSHTGYQECVCPTQESGGNTDLAVLFPHRPKLCSGQVVTSQRLEGLVGQAFEQDYFGEGTEFDSDHDLYGGGNQVEWIDLGRLDLPDRGAVVSVLDLLDPIHKCYYETPDKVVQPREEGPVRRCWRVKKGEYLGLLKKLHRTGMLQYVRERPLAVNGIMGVPKPEGRQRLIIDMREGNRFLVLPEKIGMPHPGVLARLRFSKTIKGAKGDIRNFYHRLRVPQWLARYQGLPSLPAEEVGIGGGGVVWPLYMGVPMGMSHAPVIKSYLSGSRVSQEGRHKCGKNCVGWGCRESREFLCYPVCR